MMQNAYLLAKIGADTAENEQHFAEILPTDALRRRRLGALGAERGHECGNLEQPGPVLLLRRAVQLCGQLYSNTSGAEARISLGIQMFTAASRNFLREATSFSPDRLSSLVISSLRTSQDL